MKKLILLLLFLVPCLVTSCIVKSIHPFYSREDVVFDPNLVSSWLDQDGHKWKIQPAKEEPKAYEMIFSDNNNEASFLVHLFKSGNNLFLDFLPLASDGGKNKNDLFEMHLLPSHSVAKLVRLENDEVMIQWFNEKWLHELLNRNRIKISHEAIIEENSDNDEDKTYVLTASTEELRKFLMKYGNDKAAFEGDIVAMRLKRSAK